RRSTETPAGDPGIPEPPTAVSLSCRLLRPYGAAQRRARDHSATARNHPHSTAEHHSLPEPRAPRAVPVGPALGGWRGAIAEPDGCHLPSGTLSRPFRSTFCRVSARAESRTIPRPARLTD